MIKISLREGEISLKNIDAYYKKEFKKARYLQPFMDEVEQEIEAFLNREKLIGVDYEDYLAYLESGSRLESEKNYFQNRKELVALGLYLQWNQDEKAMKRFKKLVWQVCQEYTWALPAHLKEEASSFKDPKTTLDLFAAETAQMLAEFLIVFADHFEPLLLNEVAHNIKERVLNPFYDQSWPWETFHNNWSAVCGGCIGIVALILESEERKDETVQRCLQALNCFLDGYGEDGCCTEGISYWVYGFGYYLYFIDLYEFMTGESLLEAEKITQIASFPGKIQWDLQRFVPFSDTTSVAHVPTSLQSFFYERLGIIPLGSKEVSSFHFDHCYRWGHLSRVLWWSIPLDPYFIETSQAHYLADAQWIVFKSEKLFFAAKGGHNDEPHNHNDLGHFVLGRKDQLILTDMGAGLYTADYFGQQRYEHIHTQSQWHSVPIINHQGQSTGLNYCAEVDFIEMTSSNCQFHLNLSQAYDLKTKIWRIFQLDATLGELVLIDKVEAQHAYQTNFISQELPKILDGCVLWENLQLTFQADLYDVWVDRRDIQNHFGQDEVIYRVCFVSNKQQEEYRFTFNVSLN